jgi:hypothetical protein
MRRVRLTRVADGFERFEVRKKVQRKARGLRESSRQQKARELRESLQERLRKERRQREGREDGRGGRVKWKEGVK